MAICSCCWITLMNSSWPGRFQVLRCVSLCKSPDITTHLICTPYTQECLPKSVIHVSKRPHAPKYHFSSLCKGRRVGTCCQGFDCSNGVYSRVLWDCSLGWWGRCPALLSPLVPFPCGVALILLLPHASEQGRSPRNYFHGMNGNLCGKKVLYSLPKFYPQICLCWWHQLKVILGINLSIIPCSTWSP